MEYRNYNKEFSKMSHKVKLVILMSIAVVAVLLSAVFLACTTGDGKGYRTISVIEVSGNVSVVKEGIEYRAYPGMLLQEGHELITSANSSVRLALDDDKYVKLESGSRLVFETLGLLGSGRTQMRLERGSIVTEITKPLGQEDEFIINTPNAVLAVRGTFFRIDLNQHSDGELKADVMTYGGQISSQRVLPTGEKVEEEVLIDAGFKATINMTKEDTHYVVDLEEGDTIIVDPSVTEKPDDGTESLRPTQPITTDDISTEDLIDVYFAVENGHELFVTLEEIKVDLEIRDVSLEGQKSVYDKAKEVKKEQEEKGIITGGTGNTTDATVKANDRQPLVKVEEEKKEDTTPKPDNNSNASGLVDGQHVHKEKRTTVVATCLTKGSVLVTCKDCKEVLSKKELSALGHNEVAAGTLDVHSKCSRCDEILSAEHTIVKKNSTEPGCTTVGVETFGCDCGYGYTNEIAALGHTETKGATAEAHTKCSTCNQILSSQHNLVQTDKKVPTCTTTGLESYKCDCGYTYTTEIAVLGHAWSEWTETEYATCTSSGEKRRECDICYKTEIETIPAVGHTEVKGGNENVHSACATCGMILSTKHDMLQTKYIVPSCTTVGSETYSCDCGYSYTKEIAALGHTETNGGTAEAHKKCATCNEVLDTKHELRLAGTTEPTCVIPGRETFMCDCGFIYAKTINAPGHVEEHGGTADVHSKCSVCDTVLSTEHLWIDTIIEPSDCEKDGFIKNYCSCGYIETTIIPASGHVEAHTGTADIHAYCMVCGIILSTEHNMVQTEYIAPGCDTPGYECFTCDCGYYYKNEIAPVDHSFGEWKTMREPDCIFDGQLTRECSTCHEQEHQVIDKLGHDIPEEYTVTKEPTCTEKGEKERYCTRCHSEGERIQIAELGHDYAEEYTIDQAPTCTVAGYKSKHCNTCGVSSETVRIEALGHDWTEYVTETEVTCTTRGKEVRECENCHIVDEKVIYPTGHVEIDGGEAGAHTKCSVCNEVLSAEHTFSNTVLDEATCQETGLMQYDCACGYTYTDVIGLTDHKYKAEYTIDQPATCTVNGSQSIHCTVCDYRFGSITIDAIGHVYNNWITTVLATCANEGEEKRTCKNCDHYELNVVPAEEHSYGNWTTISEATCTTDGLSTKTCSECSYVYEKITEAYGHSIVPGASQEAHSMCEWCYEIFSEEHEMVNTESVAAKCEESGSRTFVCECGYSYTEEIDPVGHNEVFGGIEGAHTMCSNCGEVYETEHEFVDTFVKTPTCTESGHYLHFCHCGYECESYPAALGHNYETKEEYGDDGFITTYEECSRCGDIINEESYIALEATNFPDDKLLWYLSQSQCDSNGNGRLSREEIAEITSLDLSGEGTDGQKTTDGGYTNLDGIEYLTALETLNVSYNTGLTALDLTGNSRIKTVDATGSGLTVFLASGCTQLETLTLDYCTYLTSTDISSSVNLDTLSVRNCESIMISFADSGHYGLSYLDARGTCIGNQNFDKISNVEVLKVSADEFELNLTSFQNLTDLYIGAGTNTYGLNVSGLSLLRNIVFEEINSIDEILATDLYLNSLIDFSKCPDLTILDLSRTGISELDLGLNDKLTSVTITGNSSLAMLDLSNKRDLSVLKLQDCTMLQMLLLNSTAVTSLDLSGCTMLKTLYASKCTSLAMVDISSCLQLESVDLSGTAVTMMSTQQLDNVIVIPQPDTPTLKYLNLSNTNINYSNCSADKYTWWGALESLVLMGAGVTDTHWNSRISTYLPQTLQELDLSYSGITSLDLSGRSALTTLSLEECSLLTSVDLTGTDNIMSLDVYNAGSEDRNFTITVTSDGIYNTADIIGWDTYMTMITAP